MSEIKQHSKNFEKVKWNYDTILNKKRLWNIAMVGAAVGKWITEEEYEEITGYNFKTGEKIQTPVEIEQAELS